MPSLYSTQGEDNDRIHLRIIRGDTDTTPTERQYLKAVEKGDYNSVNSFLEESAIYFNMNVNCVDALGRTALIMAIENENIDILELLLSYNVELGDALLFAIEEEVPMAVEILLNYKLPKTSKKDQMALMAGGKKRDSNFTPDITPVILAAHTNNYEILKVLVARGATIVKPHAVKCGCYECVQSATFDSLRHSQTRMNAYRALASPCLMILASDDPFLTAFELSWELHRLSFDEVEFKELYEKLSHQCSKFAVDLLDQTRGSQELKTILNRTTDPGDILEMSEKEGEDSDYMPLHRFKLAIEYRQKEFVAHPNCQQLLSHMWYQGIPGWKQGNLAYKLLFTLMISFTFPFTSVIYILFPFIKSASVLKNPFVKFINHSASYLLFLLMLVFASSDMFNTYDKRTSRSRKPNIPEWIIVWYVAGFIWNEMKEVYENGFTSYSHDLWNIMDFIQNTLYLSTISLRIVVYFGPDITVDREEMSSGDPMLVAEALFAVANISSSLRLLYLFTANSHLGPLQISLGKMVIDVIKFLFIFALVLISFASGMNQLLYLEYSGGVDVVQPGDCKGVTCSDQNSQFISMYDSVITLFWTVMGIVDLHAISINEDHTFTKQMGMMMYLVYHIIAIVILLNMLIAMMNLSYENIVLKSDVEWKYSRSRLWMSYFEEGKTVPPPFNIIVSPKSVWYGLHRLRTLCVADLAELKQRQNVTKLASKMKELERKYQDSMTNLTQRYIANLKKTQDFEPVTEDDLNEIKQDISSFRYEVVELLKRQLGEEGDEDWAGGGGGGANPTGGTRRSGSRSIKRRSIKPTTMTKTQSATKAINNNTKAITQAVTNSIPIAQSAPGASGYCMMPVYLSRDSDLAGKPFILLQDPNNPDRFAVSHMESPLETQAAVVPTQRRGSKGSRRKSVHISAPGEEKLFTIGGDSQKSEDENVVEPPTAGNVLNVIARFEAEVEEPAQKADVESIEMTPRETGGNTDKPEQASGTQKQKMRAKTESQEPLIDPNGPDSETSGSLGAEHEETALDTPDDALHAMDNMLLTQVSEQPIVEAEEESAAPEGGERRDNSQSKDTVIAVEQGPPVKPEPRKVEKPPLQFTEHKGIKFLPPKSHKFSKMDLTPKAPGGGGGGAPLGGSAETGSYLWKSTSSLEKF